MLHFYPKYDKNGVPLLLLASFRDGKSGFSPQDLLNRWRICRLYHSELELDLDMAELVRRGLIAYKPQNDDMQETGA